MQYKAEKLCNTTLGVYAVKVKINDLIKKGIANVGYRPTFKGKSLLLETNILELTKTYIIKY